MKKFILSTLFLLSCNVNAGNIFLSIGADEKNCHYFSTLDNSCIFDYTSINENFLIEIEGNNYLKDKNFIFIYDVASGQVSNDYDEKKEVGEKNLSSFYFDITTNKTNTVNNDILKVVVTVNFLFFDISKFLALDTDNLTYFYKSLPFPHYLIDEGAEKIIEQERLIQDIHFYSHETIF